MQVECDAFTDLYSIWDLICKRYLEAVTACQTPFGCGELCRRPAAATQTVLPAAVEPPQDTKTSNSDHLNRKRLH